MKRVLGLMSFVAIVALLTAASDISEQCEIHEQTRITCHCVGNEVRFLSCGYLFGHSCLVLPTAKQRVTKLVLGTFPARRVQLRERDESVDHILHFCESSLL